MTGPVILFSVFEPSGDVLAARALEALREVRPDVQAFALGGPNLEAAGATLLAHTTGHATMFLESVAKLFEHRALLRRLRSWLRDNPLALLIPVDSPAANWSVCHLARREATRARIVHLVMPQLWAWASWRIRRLRRLTDHVLCILPFEPDWLAARGVRGTFIGHPMLDPARPTVTRTDDLPQGHPRLALLPGSRGGEMRANWPTMRAAFARLAATHPELIGIVAALDDHAEATLRAITGEAGDPWPAAARVVCGRTDDVIAWADVALACSGTATLQIAGHRTPLVALYNMNPLFVKLVLRFVVATRTYTLPNLIGEWLGLGRVMTELVPHYGEVDPVVREVDALLSDTDGAAAQRARLGEVIAPFADRSYSEGAARELAAMLRSPGPPRRGGWSIIRS